MKTLKATTLSLFLILTAFSCTKEDDEIIELAQVTVTATSNVASELGAQGAFTFKLTNRLNVPVQISFDIKGTATNGTDYESITNTITIPEDRLTIALPVNVISDELEEGTEDIIIKIISTDNDAISIGTTNEATVTITDTPPAFVLNPNDTKSYLVNPNATDETAALFYNLKILSETQFVVGQQDAFNSFFNNNGGDSDMKKTTGSDPGLLGSDFMFITDDNNDEDPSNWFYQQELQIKGDVIQAYDKGIINIFSWHIREPYEGDEFYTANMTEFQKNNAFKSILPGGANHEYYKQKLDKVASVAESLIGNDGKLIPFIFRPFHEFDGDWFWWGKSYCSPQEFITLWRFTVEYLRDVKNLNNILFAFSPDKNFESTAVYLNRYPGDNYVDILGMDNYGDFDNMGMAGIDQANAKLKIISDLAKERIKIAALTESCYFVTPGQNSPIPNFYSEHLYNALTNNNVEIGFMMFWYNYEDTYCVPPPNQSSASDFIEFANKTESVLADELPNMYAFPGG